jgi:diguanylate cyclase (GGDEF)-like protein
VSGHVGDRPPRLVLRFAVVTALCLGIGGAAILVFMRHLNTVNAERNAAAHAQFLAESVLSHDLDAADFSGPVSASRRRELDELFERKVLRPGTVLVTLSRPDRLVTYSTDHRLIGRVAASAERTREAIEGTVTSDVTSIPGASAREERLRVLRSYVPVTVEGRKGVAAVHQDYRPIAAAARAALLPVAGILEVVLVLLFVLLVPLLVRVSRRLRRYLERIQHQALHDDLTELPNRLHFRDRISHAVEAAEDDGSKVAVLLLDLDRFKEINETLGHDSGDALLRAFTHRLSELAGDDVFLARLGGDEFGLVAPGMGAGEARDLAGRVSSCLEATFLVKEVPLFIEASIGISIYPDHATEVEGLLQAADGAMYAAKDRRLGVFLYDGALDASTTDALTLVSELRPALERNELVLHFQPQLELKSGEIVGAEALVRWQHPERGLLPPGAFVPFVERTGASRALSDYVLAAAAIQLRDWRTLGFDLGVAVNLTMFDLLDARLPERVEKLLERSGVEPERFELEITESVIMGDPARVFEVVEWLKAIGVRLAIDDFGTGYSSLSYLKSLPIDVLKIDRSFVMNMEANESDSAIVRSTVDLAHNLGLTVVAEGVDSAATLEELTRYGCDVAQGFHIARPCAADDFWAAVADFRAPAAQVA